MKTPAILAHIPDSLKHGGDGGAVVVAVGTFMSYLPNVAALLSVVWLSLRIYETVLNLRDRKKAAKDEIQKGL